MKNCITCNNEKPYEDFNKCKRSSDGRTAKCKDCRNEYLAKYRSKNRDNILAKRNEWKTENKDRLDKVNRAYYDNNIESIKAKRKEQWQKYYSKNKEVLAKRDKIYKSKNLHKRRENAKVRRKNDPIFNLRNTISSRTAKAFTNKGYSKRTKTFKMLGCDWETAKAHIENQFTDGMSWSKRSDWHIDHIIPLSSADDVNELNLLCHYTNLQPLWAKDNLIKKDKVNYEDKKRYLEKQIKRFCK